MSENKGLTEKVSGGGSAGQKYDTIKELEGVVQMAKLNDTHAVVLMKNGEKPAVLKTVPLP